MTLRSTWTPEDEERLTLMWNDGMSASQIAVRIGRVSRNAVIGKVHRLRLVRHKGPSQSRAEIIDRRERERMVRIKRVVVPKPVKAPPPPPPEPWDGPSISILDDGLHRFMCREIVAGSGAGTMYCGAPTVPGSQFSYCAYHGAKNLVQATRKEARPHFVPYRVAA